MRQIPTGIIKWVVDQMHVMTPPKKVAMKIVKEASVSKYWTMDDIDLAVGMALYYHEKNRKLYRDVVSGG